MAVVTRRITVPLPEPVAEALFALAEREMRGGREQAAVLIREAIEARERRARRARAAAAYAAPDEPAR